MTKTKEKTGLVVKEEKRPDTYFGEMERYFDKFFRNPFSLMTPSLALRDFPTVGELTPSVDIFEEGNDLVLKAELPGMTKDDLNVTITENRITISGEKKQEEKVEKKDYHWVERCYGSFCRSFRLPEYVNGDAAKASFKDGVLEIRLPKTKEAKQKKITVT
ncbi:MAG TPA: Hsp20/alpha crystallin family protein [Desulfobacteraceae bacterium]|nr:Hsp20/alpha crystallin family protein [Desulfobacteraceae bacterium]